MTALVHIRCPYCEAHTTAERIARTVNATCSECGNVIATKTQEEVVSDMEMDRLAAREFGGAA